MSKNETTLSIVTKVQLLDVMLGSVKGRDGEWSVLYLDSFTTQIMSNICGISDLLDYGISLVDNISNMSRQNAGQHAAICFITPTDENVNTLVSSFSTKLLGKKNSGNMAVHIFFSSTPLPHHIEEIKRCSGLINKLQTLKEANVEYVLFPDSRGFTTGPDNALQRFFSHGAELCGSYEDNVMILCQRLASLFVTMKEMPSIRYRAGLLPGDEYPSGLDARLLLPQRLAVELHQQLENYQDLNQIPEGETCELIIIDRGFDAVAPIIHEWTYESMIHDILDRPESLSGRVYTCTTSSESGLKEHVLDEKDAIFTSLRHKHFAEATKEITGYMDGLMSTSRLHRSKNKSVRDMDLKSMAKLVQSLPKYQDDLRTLNVHVDIASELNKHIDASRLTDFGALEQDIVCGDATSKELITFLSSNQLMDSLDKLRLLLCYSSTHLEKLDEVRESQWQKLARLDRNDMRCLKNLEYLGIPVCKRSRGSLSGISFGRKKKNAIRRDKNILGVNNQEYTLSRFVPLLAEKMEELISGKISEDEYPYVRPPRSPTVSSSYSESSLSYDGSQPKELQSKGGIVSFRTLRPGGTWTGKGNSASEHSDSKKKGRVAAPLQGRIFIYVIGGFTYSELRVVHHLSSKLNKDVFIGGTSLIKPKNFIEDLRLLDVCLK